MKRSLLPILLVFLLAALAGCGKGTQTDAQTQSQTSETTESTAQTPETTEPATTERESEQPIQDAASEDPTFAGDWVTYASSAGGKTTVYDSFFASEVFHLKSGGSLTVESTDASHAGSGTWTTQADDTVLLQKDGATLYTLEKINGSAGQVSARSPKGTVVVAGRTDTAQGKEALLQRKKAFQGAASGKNGWTRSFTASLTGYAEKNGNAQVKVNEVIWVDGADTAALSFFGINPAEVLDGYSIYDATDSGHSYGIASGADYTIYGEEGPQTVDKDGFASAMAENSGTMLAKVTLSGNTLTGIEQIYVP